MSRPPKRISGIENRRHKAHDGTVSWTFRVRWVDPSGARRSEEFASQRDALDFKAALRLAKRQGTLADLDAGQETLTQFVEEWWQTYAVVNLERNTLKTYATVWNRHLLPRIGELELRAVTPRVVATLRSDLERDGVGAPTVLKALVILQSVLSRAVEWQRVQVNAAAAVRKPRPARRRAINALAPLQVELIRRELDPQDATLVSVLAYAGLRPEEVLALEWRHVRRRTMLIEQKSVDGQIEVGQKTFRPPRTIDLLDSLAEDLSALRSACRPQDGDLVFPKADGSPWRVHDWKNWRRRRFNPAADNAQVKISRPYDLRHSFASLLLHEGRLSVIEIANQLGHSAETLLSTYAHVIAELKDQPKLPADDQIKAARAQLEPPRVRRRSGSQNDLLAERILTSDGTAEKVRS